MFKTIKYSVTGKPLIDVNEQGVFYSYRTKQIKQLKLSRSKNPYYCWCDEEDGEYKTHYAHIEVAKAFPEICGEWFEGCHVHHKDGNPLNNEATNLIVCTKQEHVQLHRELKLRQLNLQNRRERRRRGCFSEALERFRNNGKYHVTYYCRESKKKRNGLAPLEVSILQSGERYFMNSGYYARPEDVKKGLLPEGFADYLDSIIV